MPKFRLIVAAMLDLRNLIELGIGPPPFPFRVIPSPLVARSTLPNLPLLLKSNMAALAFALPQNTPALQAKVGII